MRNDYFAAFHCWAHLMLLQSAFFREFCQFNAFHGCPYCLSPGKTVQTSSKGHTHAYPFDDNNLRTGHGEPRTHEQTLKFAAEATKKSAQNGIQNSVKGVKGYSWFMFVPKFDIIRGVAIDYMHSTLLGVVKMFGVTSPTKESHGLSVAE